MAREIVHFREMLAEQCDRIDKFFPDKENLNIIEVCKILGVSRSTFNRKYKSLRKIQNNGVFSKVKLAEYIIRGNIN